MTDSDFRRRHLPYLILIVVVAAASAQGARQERETIFERLDGAERRAGDARDGATWFDGEMERSWEAAGKMRADLEVAERAVDPSLRDELRAAVGEVWITVDPSAATDWLSTSGLPPALAAKVRAAGRAARSAHAS